MGVPKFFRWMSERYPAISQLIAENRIPEFDCLYLDMNGIIHNCTHNDSDSVTKRMTEDQMFIAIFNYIEHLFGKIKPKQLFFMAIDGVAPRAKMNQQRARRFRTARDAEDARNKAIAAGTEMPKEDAFDSNCITPGTQFMARLTQQLKYFVNKKVSEDYDWQNVEVVLSGHEVPGEGEHKIMEYIRKAKSQPGYDPNMRHCLYGLDADLIMLGLLSHDPHFCLLREEVTFGRQSKGKSKELEHQNFYLMHLCIVREYLELEFQELKEPGALSFTFDMERVIDDFILMAFFVGNDFLPNLPHLHINEGALALMFAVYKNVLPKAKGYINEGGVINLERLGLLLDELSHVEYRHFESENSDASWMKDKTMKKEDVMDRQRAKNQIVMSTAQKAIYDQVKKYINGRSADSDPPPFDLPTTLPARDRKFVEQLASDMHLQWKSVADDAGDRHMQISFPPRPVDDDDDEEEDEEAQTALLRVMKKYDKGQIVDVTPEDAQAKMEKKYEEKFQKWKDEYYKEKYSWGLDNEAEMRKLTENYVQGLQWVLFYYYRGVASWPWYYGYHYSPMISDVKKGLKADMNFKLGQPFRPYQQLMGVLPDRSKKIVPEVYHELMTQKDSPIIDFYPRDFELDMNGKKQDWEAVVQIPFIDEKRLLAAMAPKDKLLSPDEQARNDFGVTLKFAYQKDLDYVYPSSLPGIFPDLPHCKCVENIFEMPTMEGLHVYVGLVEGVKLGKQALAGFPSLHNLVHTGQLGFHGVSVFQSESRNESMVITILESETSAGIELAKQKLGKAVHVGYPFLQEGKVTRVSDELFSYVLQDPSKGSEPANIVQQPHQGNQIADWKKKSQRLESMYSKRLGVITGDAESMVHVDMLVGLRKTDEGATVKEYAQVPGQETDYLTQMVVDEVLSPDQRFLEKSAVPFEEEFPNGTQAFFLGDFNYGRPLVVTGHTGSKAEIWISTVKGKEPEFGRDVARQQERLTPYTPGFAVAKMLHLHPLALSKITSSFRVMSSGLQLNLGLNLKFEAKKQKVLGYSRKGERGWEYSQKAIELIAEYMTTFPDFIATILRNPEGDGFQDVDFYPDAQVAKAKMKEIGEWLKRKEAKHLERVPLDAEQMDGDAVMAIESAADQNNQNPDQVDGKRVGGVPRNALLKPSDAEQRLGNQKFSLGDRVVYAQDSGRVPIALRGTVVGITRTPRTVLLDVVFDSTFMSGTTLGERCSPFRGSTVPVTSVLNLTDKQVVATSKAAQTRQPSAAFTPLQAQQNGYTAARGSYGAPAAAGGLGQMREAAAPGPLRGSFRGALGGSQPNGTPYMNGAARGRGRGGLGSQQTMPIRGGPPQRGGRGAANGFVPRGGRGGSRGGYTVVDNTDPMAGVQTRNPNFKPQNYSSVPPPPNLNADRGRGRGRGGVDRGRGSARSRGRGAPAVNEASAE
ncbi:5'-3' exoribonuclease 1 [Sphaceloma murrayae]|uniref:5'-3' exoribonuclease 1 n=1 Tax=Sphaceloma murrayae TaxID=2082308 RepID=A0A2K1QN91_9PEZI|nr:5'-3' exoribonuclease 1 [Sphaceloma murrayae]